MRSATEATINRRRKRVVAFVRLCDQHVGLMFVLPTVLVLATVIGYPIVRTMWLSFSDVKLGQEATPFVGLDNYQRVFADRLFRMALRNSLIWMATSVTAVVLVGLLAALVLNERLPGRKLIQSAVLLPWIIPAIVAAVTWKWLYHPNFGIVNDILLRTGLIQSPTNWLGDPAKALYAVILVNIWKSFPFAMLMLLAGLQGVPEELYEAARVDGAGAPQRLWYVTLPLLRPVIIVVALLLTIWNMNTFTYLYVLTQGGPMRMTEVFGLYIYMMSFRFFRFGIATAAAMIVFMISILLAMVYLLLLKASDAT